MAQLEGRLRELERERYVGIRSVDAVEDDITAIQSEIKKLRAKYLSGWFW